MTENANYRGRNGSAVLCSALLFALITAACSESADLGGDSSAAKPPPQSFRWRMVTAWPKNFPGLGTAPEHFARKVEKMSAGRLKIRVYAGGELVPALEVFDAVSRGTAEMGHSGTYFDKGKILAAQLFTGIPFGLTAQEMNAWIHYGGGLELFRKVYGRYGIMPLAGGNTGVQMAGWFNREIHSVEDLRGLRMRIPGVGGDVLNRLGSSTVTLPGSELYTSMQTGVIDATEWVGPYNDLAFGLHEVAKYYYYPGWHEPGSMMYFGINLKAWAELPEDLQEIVVTAARAVNADLLDEYTARNQDALQQLIEQHGVQLRRLPDEVLRRLREESSAYMEELARRDPQTAEVYRSYRAFYRKVRAYHEISERAYLNAR